MAGIQLRAVHMSVSTVLSQYVTSHEKSDLTTTQKFTLAMVSLHLSLHSVRTYSLKDTIQPYTYR